MSQLAGRAHVSVHGDGEGAGAHSAPRGLLACLEDWLGSLDLAVGRLAVGPSAAACSDAAPTGGGAIGRR